jgi:hypothetical protein
MTPRSTTEVVECNKLLCLTVSYMSYIIVKFDVNVRSRSVNLHARDKLWQFVHLQLCTSQHICFVRARKQSPVQIQSTLSCF